MILLKKNDKENISEVSGTSSQIEGASIVDFKLKGDTLQNDTPTPSSPIPIECVTGEQNVNMCGKNLLPNNVTSQTINNIQFVKNDDGSITMNGTSNAIADFYFLGTSSQYEPLNLETGTYNLSGCNNGALNTYMIYMVLNRNGTLSYYQSISSSGLNISIQKGDTFRIFIRVLSGQSVSNITIKPMLEKGSSATTYEEYNGNTYNVNLGKNLFVPTLKVETTNIFTARCDVSLNENEYTFNTTGSDCYFGNIIASGNAYQNQFGTLYDVQGFNNLVFKPTNSAFDKNYVCYFDINKISLGFNQISNSTGLITLPANTKYICFRIGISNSTSGGTYTTSFQLERGSQATPYSSYFPPYELNKISTNEDYIRKSTGINLFDKSTIIEGKYIDGNGNVQTDANSFIGDYICIDNTKPYYINSNLTNAKRIVYYNSSKTFISRELVTTTGSSLTIPNNAYYVIISGYISDLDTLQLEQNTTASPYEHYGKVWYIYKATGSATFNGSENWQKGTNTYQFYLSRLTNMLGASSLIINRFINQETASNNGLWLSTNFINVNYLECTTVEQFKTWLASNNVEIVYILETPTTTEITNTELINQLEAIRNVKLLNGENNIIITASDLVGSYEISYSNWYEFEKILRSGYNIKEDYDRITQKFINGRRKQILSENKDCIIQLSLGTFDLETTVEYLKMLEDGEYQYYSFDDKDYKRAEFLLEEKPEIIVENSIKNDDAEVEDFNITLLKAGE